MFRTMSLNRALMRATGAAAALALGLALIAMIEISADKGMSLVQGLVEFFSYFTILANMLAAALLFTSFMKPNSKMLLARSTAISATTVYLVSLGLFYSLALRNFWNPQGPLQVLSDALLHEVVPILCLAVWLTFTPKGMLKWLDAVIWLIFPFVYWVYVFLRGAISGAYPYPLVDVASRGSVRALTNAAIHLTSILLLGLCAVAVDRWLARTHSSQKRVS